MNIKNSILAAALAAGVMGAATATPLPVVYISGSTAFRGPANQALINYVTNTPGGTNNLLAIDNSAIASAGNMLLSVSNGAALIKVAWNGSEAGNQSAAGPATGQSNAATFSYYTNTATGWTNAVSTNNSKNDVHTADLAFSDTYQSTSLYIGKLGLYNGQTVNYATLKGFDGGDGIVGVVGFTWAGSKGISSNAVVNFQNARYLMANGLAPLALFTGGSNDWNTGCFLLGRNVDSGTRLTTMAETGYGVRGSVVQFAVATGFNGGTTNGSSSAATLVGTNQFTNIIAYPEEVINGVDSKSPGNSGYSSGGTLCGFLTNTYGSGANFTYVDAGLSTNNAAFSGSNYLIGYAGVTDASSKVASGLQDLAYNGQFYSTNGIANGVYTFWGYEHLYVSGNASSFATNLAPVLGANITNTPTANLLGNVALSSMNASRSVDGGVVSYNYTSN